MPPGCYAISWASNYWWVYYPTKWTHTPSYIPRHDDRDTQSRCIIPEEARVAKLTTTYTKCGNYDYWRSNHLDDGNNKFYLWSSSTPMLKSNEKQGTNANPRSSTPCRAKSEHFDNASHSVTSSGQNEDRIDAGPIVESGAPYSAIVFTKLVNLAVDIAQTCRVSWNQSLKYSTI